MRGLAKTSREPGAMELVDVETPEPASNEVLIEVDYAGLCGSDAGIYKFKSAFERMEMPTIIGHEYTGRVVERGEEASRFSVGERVVERPIRGCGECFQCQIGEESICQDAVLTGIDLDGAYAGYIAVPSRRSSRSRRTSNRSTRRSSNRRRFARVRSFRTPGSKPATECSSPVPVPSGCSARR